MMSHSAPLFYRQAGQGPVVVLLHGFPLDSRMWQAQLDGLADRYRVIAPDLRGFGNSRGSEPFSIADLAADVHALLLSLKVTPCVVGGLSMGGYVAMNLAKRCPADLAGLMLIDTKPEADDTTAKAARLKTVDTVRNRGTAPIIEAMVPRLLAPATLQGRPGVVAQLRQIMQDCPASDVEMASLAMCDREDFTAHLASIAVPTLVVVGQHDALSPVATAQFMQQQIPRAQLEVIADAGHMAPMEQPTAVNAAIRKWLDQLGLTA